MTDEREPEHIEDVVFLTVHEGRAPAECLEPGETYQFYNYPPLLALWFNDGSEPARVHFPALPNVDGLEVAAGAIAKRDEIPWQVFGDGWVEFTVSAPLEVILMRRPPGTKELDVELDSQS